jgi:hypothetical protein
MQMMLASVGGVQTCGRHRQQRSEIIAHIYEELATWNVPQTGANPFA